MVSLIRMVSYVGHSCARMVKSKFLETWVRDHVVHLGLNVSSSAHNCKVLNNIMHNNIEQIKLCTNFI